MKGLGAWCVKVWIGSRGMCMNDGSRAGSDASSLSTSFRQTFRLQARRAVTWLDPHVPPNKMHCPPPPHTHTHTLIPSCIQVRRAVTWLDPRVEPNKMHCPPPPHTHTLIPSCLQVRRAVTWLDPRVEPNEMRRLAALMLLREMAEQSPAVFNVHVKVWVCGGGGRGGGVRGRMPDQGNVRRGRVRWLVGGGIVRIRARIGGPLHPKSVGGGRAQDQRKELSV